MEGGGGGGMLPDFSFCYIFPVQQTTSGIGRKVVFFGLATNTLNVRNNNIVTCFPPDWGMLRRSRCIQIFL